MIELQSKVLNKTIHVDRLIGKLESEEEGPTLIFTGGIHGNEPSGVFALNTVVDQLKSQNIPFKGNLYAISGNLSALKKGVRFDQKDLNRQWTRENVRSLHEKEYGNVSDREEQLEIHQFIESILATHAGPFYFFDLHTTSSETIPFLTINDSVINRKFTRQYPLSIVLGIEEFLEGPLLSYINELGYVAFGFEAGQHDAVISYENHISFAYLSMVYAGFLDPKDINYMKYHHHLEKQFLFTDKFYEILHRYEIKESAKFAMYNGFRNFQKIKKHAKLATSNGEIITAPMKGHIFMPLYQGKGNDGFFVIRSVPRLFLRLSLFLRKVYFDRFLVLLPGISWASKQREALRVNLRVARFYTKQLFHLLGYRSKTADETHLIMTNREVASKMGDYKRADWFK